MLLADVVTASTEVGAQSSRLAKISRIAALLGAAAAGDAHQVAVVVSWLSGELPQRQIGVGWAALRTLPARCQELLRIVAFVPRPDYQAVSAELGMPVGSIGPTRGRCLDKIRALLGDEPDGRRA